MGADSKIEWTHHTFNPWWGCTRVSPGCVHCYAETFAKRTGLAWGPQAERRFFGDKHWNEPLKWNRMAEAAGERRRVFCASMADVFEDRPELHVQRERLFDLIAATPWLDWLLLTKRPENAARLAPASWATGWPRNVWAMTTAEDQQRADERIPTLLEIPAAVHGVSYEPAIGPVDFTRIRSAEFGIAFDALHGFAERTIRIDWIIVGGESGPGARPFDIDWARDTVEQCKAADVACFVKQLGAHPEEEVILYGIGPYGPAKEDVEVRSLRLKDKKGGDWDEWPADLRVRQFPAVPRA
jgi:protein gp37